VMEQAPGGARARGEGDGGEARGEYQVDRRVGRGWRRSWFLLCILLCALHPPRITVTLTTGSLFKLEPTPEVLMHYAYYVFVKTHVCR